MQPLSVYKPPIRFIICDRTERHQFLYAFGLKVGVPFSSLTFPPLFLLPLHFRSQPRSRPQIELVSSTRSYLPVMELALLQLHGFLETYCIVESDDICGIVTGPYLGGGVRDRTLKCHIEKRFSTGGPKNS